MELSILDRVILLDILPAEAKLADYRIVTDLRAKIGFTEDEFSAHNIRQENDARVLWDGEKNINVEFGDRAKQIVLAGLKKIDEAGHVNHTNIGLFEKFGYHEES